MAETKGKIAVVLVRGRINLKPDVLFTLNMLRLYRKNSCMVMDDTPAGRGMLKRVKDYATFGEVDDALLADLASKRGQPAKDDDKALTINSKKYNRVFHLAPPRKGFERKGIKEPYSRGGATGNRGSKMADLLRRMM
ncbi:uL30 family ribosomal protein [Candidatus Woesearchaeota archaeon]|nr:uL30 family ribosomal protein [Candidatus Woesearchaeota archaeon]